MEIIDYFESSEKEHWLSEIERCEWGAAKFLAELLKGTESNYGTFENALGKGRLYLLTEGSALISFATLSEQDCIADKSMTPWIGFVYTYPEYRGHRYMGRIIGRALSDAAAQGFDRVYVATDHIGLYEKYGFSYLENRKSVWGEDDRVYVIKINGGEP